MLQALVHLAGFGSLPGFYVSSMRWSTPTPSFAAPLFMVALSVPILAGWAGALVAVAVVLQACSSCSAVEHLGTGFRWSLLSTLVTRSPRW